jgi:hypothetical protein
MSNPLELDGPEFINFLTNLNNQEFAQILKQVEDVAKEVGTELPSWPTVVAQLDAARKEDARRRFLHSCPHCGLDGNIGQQKYGYECGQHENDKECIAFLKSIGIAAEIMSSATHDRLQERYSTVRLAKFHYLGFLQ